MRFQRLLILLILVILTAACSRLGDTTNTRVEIDGFSTEVTFSSGPTSYVVDCTPYEGETEVSYEAVTGTTASGAEFVLYKPTEWASGDLVLYAHGYIPPGEPIGYPAELPQDLNAVRDGLLCGGYAMAASSYSANGFAIEEGAEDTHLLNPIFGLIWEDPQRTFLIGASLGGAVTIKLAEFFPQRYDGALPLCGMIGGSRLQLAYVGSTALMFRHFFPGVLGPSVTSANPDALFTLPADLPEAFGSIEANLVTPDPDTVAGQIVAAVRADPEALQQLASVQVTLPDPLDNTQQLGPFPLVQALQEQDLVASLLGALQYYVVGLNEIQARAGGKPFDSSGITYLLGGEVLDAPTYLPDPEAMDYLTRNYQPSGLIRIPTLSVHNTADPDTPYLHVLLYEGLTGYWNTQDNFLAVPVPRFGHCNFSADEVAMAFFALQDWARTGQKPSAPTAFVAP